MHKDLGCTKMIIICSYFLKCSEARPCYGSCINLTPGYRCAGCPPGYSGNAPSGIGLEEAQNSTQKCVDIDECALKMHSCDPNAACVNTLVCSASDELICVKWVTNFDRNCISVVSYPR